MARFKAVWGPNKEEIEGHRIKWFFSCVFEDGDVRGYTLRFYYASRKFSVKPHFSGQSAAYARRMAEKDLLALPELQRAEVITGKTVTEILRQRLGDERIAQAIALAMRHGRK